MDNIDHQEVSKVCNCRRTDIRGVLQHVKDKYEECAFYRATKFYFEHYLSWVENITYHLGEDRLGHYSMYPIKHKQQRDGNISNTKNLSFRSTSIF